MAKFHINSSGESGHCRAEKGGCPFGGDDQHYDTAAEASQAYEKKMADQVVPEPIEREHSRETALPKLETPEVKKTALEEMKEIGEKTNALRAQQKSLHRADRDGYNRLEKEMQELGEAYQKAYRSLPDYEERVNLQKAVSVGSDIQRLEGNIRYLNKLAYAPRQKDESRAAYKERMRMADGGEMMPAVKRTDNFLGIEEWDPAQPGYKIQIEQKTAELRKLQDEYDILKGREPKTEREPVKVDTYPKPEGGLRGFFSRF